MTTLPSDVSNVIERPKQTQQASVKSPCPFIQLFLSLQIYRKLIVFSPCWEIDAALLLKKCRHHKLRPTCSGMAISHDSIPLVGSFLIKTSCMLIQQSLIKHQPLLDQECYHYVGVPGCLFCVVGIILLTRSDIALITQFNSCRPVSVHKQTHSCILTSRCS